MGGRTNRTFKKSTEEEIGTMAELYMKGTSLVEIGRILSRDHYSVIYQLKKLGIFKSKDGMARYNLRRKLEMMERKQLEALLKKQKEEKAESENLALIESLAQKKREEEAERERIAGITCHLCGKEKQDIHWARTHYCGLNCWNEAFLKSDRAPQEITYGM